MWPNPQFPADLVTFTEEILNGKLHFLCSVRQSTNFTNRISCSNFPYVEPRPSAENIGVTKFLSPPTQLIFTVSVTNVTMNFANVYLFLTYPKSFYETLFYVGRTNPYFTLS